MGTEYIVYYKTWDSYVSKYDETFETSEFPEEYKLFSSRNEALLAILFISNKYGLPRESFQVEEF